MNRRAATKPRPPLLVGIAGGSGSGKTWLADQLSILLRDCGITRICLDDFYFDRSHLTAAQRTRINFDHPRAIDWNALLSVIEVLLSGRSARVPCYDFATHCRKNVPRVLSSKPVIILEGLWPFRHPKLRRLFDIRIFIECGARTRFERRLRRDLKSRGRTRASIQEQFQKAVEPMHLRFVAPQSRWATIILKNKWGQEEVRQVVTTIRSLLK